MSDRKSSKIIFRTFSGVVVGIMGSVHFRLVPWSSIYFSRSVGPFLYSQCQLLGFNLLHLSLPSSSLCFHFCSLVFSVSNFHPDTEGAVVDTFFFF